MISEIREKGYWIKGVAQIIIVKENLDIKNMYGAGKTSIPMHMRIILPNLKVRIF